MASPRWRSEPTLNSTVHLEGSQLVSYNARGLEKLSTNIGCALALPVLLPVPSPLWNLALNALCSGVLSTNLLFTSATKGKKLQCHSETDLHSRKKTKKAPSDVSLFRCVCTYTRKQAYAVPLAGLCSGRK